MVCRRAPSCLAICLLLSGAKLKVLTAPLKNTPGAPSSICPGTRRWACFSSPSVGRRPMGHALRSRLCKRLKIGSADSEPRPQGAVSCILRRNVGGERRVARESHWTHPWDPPQAVVWCRGVARESHWTHPWNPPPRSRLVQGSRAGHAEFLGRPNAPVRVSMEVAYPDL